MKRLLAIMLLTAATLTTAHAASSRDSWVVQQMYAYNHPYASQLPGELSTKMTKMATGGVFAFYRGTSSLFYQDMKTLPASDYSDTATDHCWLVGDMHLQNVGAFRDADGNTVFDVNDYDEGYWGPYVWDLRRMAVSILLAAEENGLSQSDGEDLAHDFVDAYLDKMRDFKGNHDELDYRLTADNTNGVVKDTIQAAEDASRSHLLDKDTEVSDGIRQFRTTAKLQPVDSATDSAILSAMGNYIDSIPSKKQYAASYYTVKDIREKLGSGIGSLGRYRYWVLLEGPSSDNDDDVIIELKQEATSAVAIAAPGQMPDWVYDSHQGKRVMKTMKALLTNTDLLAGYTTINSLPFFVREKSPYQEDFDYTELTSYSKFHDAARYAGKALATVHALSDKDYDDTLIPYSMDKEVTDIVPSHSDLEDEILAFAEDYEAQVKLDYQSFLTAYYDGTPLY